MPTFGDRFWQMLAAEMQRRAAANLPAPTREERIALLNKLHEDEIMRALAERIKTMTTPAAGLFDGVAHARAPAKPKRQKPYASMTEEEFIASLEAEPFLQGVDVKREIGRCQFWCRWKGREATRMTILNWLKKADKVVGFNGAGASSRGVPAKPMLAEPRNWRTWLDANRPESVYCTGGAMGFKQWADLEYPIRKYITDEMAKAS